MSLSLSMLPILRYAMLCMMDGWMDSNLAYDVI